MWLGVQQNHRSDVRNISRINPVNGLPSSGRNVDAIVRDNVVTICGQQILSKEPRPQIRVLVVLGAQMIFNSAVRYESVFFDAGHRQKHRVFETARRSFVNKGV
jgi:hypothetical protein